MRDRSIWQDSLYAASFVTEVECGPVRDDGRDLRARVDG
jgi:hypothetical protein